MKYLKILGLAAVAAATLMAFVGASTASATVLCRTTPTGAPGVTSCPSGWDHPSGTEIHAVNVGVVSLHTKFKTIECKKSTVQGKTENTGSATETIRGPVEVLTFEECNCEVKVLTKGTVEVHSHDYDHDGVLTANGQEVTVTCSTIFGNVHCIYTINNKELGEITSGAPAIFHANVTVERKVTNKMLCDEEAVWTATYEVTSPSPLYFADTG